jgi:hypothetical protein
MSAFAVAVFNALNVAGLTALVSTRIYDKLPRNPSYPCVEYTLTKDQRRGLGRTELPEMTLRVSVFSTSDTQAEGQAIVAKVEDLLSDATLTITGYRLCGLVVWRESVDLGAVEVNGVKVTEWVVQFTAWVEAS